jgi:hypothetical protein
VVKPETWAKLAIGIVIALMAFAAWASTWTEYPW